jgi:hypothetical protein
MFAGCLASVKICFSRCGTGGASGFDVLDVDGDEGDKSLQLWL